MRVGKACLRCREAKRKCLRDESTLRCNPCKIRGEECSLSQRAKSGFRVLGPSASDRSPSSHEQLSTALLDEKTSTELLQRYMDCVHDKSHSLFHLKTVLRDAKAGAIRRDLLYIICAMGSRMSQDQDVRRLGNKLFARAKQLFMANSEDVCLESVHSATLIANYCAAELEISSEAIYFGIATRMAHILVLDKTNGNDNVVLQEIKRRTWWSLFMADRWVSSGMNLPRLIHHLTPHLELPMDEFTFQNLSPDQELLETPRELGLWAFMITLVDVFSSIHDLNRSLVDATVAFDDVEGHVSSLAARLRSWEDGLPLRVRFSIENFQYHQKRNTGDTFIVLHLGYHHYATLLYFQYLDRQASPLFPLRDTYAARCKTHASAYSQILAFSRKSQESSVLHITAGHMAAVSSSVMLHTMLFGDEQDSAAARESLMSNFDALIELRNYWPSLSKVVERLFNFQHACLWSADLNTHRVDEWMLRFLLEYALPFDKKHTTPSDAYVEVPTATTIVNVGGRELGKIATKERREMADREMARLRTETK